MADDFDPIAYINEPRWSHSSLGLERIALLVDKLGHPERDLRFIHVAGTNGKGSTCAYISSILEHAGYRCGLFTSPYIERFEERIRVNGVDISLEELSRATLEVKAAACIVERELGEHPTEFELMCAVALLHFKAAACDVVVMEVGLGGRLDSTNVIEPDLCVISRIGLDHTSILGDTIEKIAAEKAGIIKSGVPVVSCVQVPEAMDVIVRKCAEMGCTLATFDMDETVDAGLDMDKGVRRFSFRDMDYETALLGSYQMMNAACAIASARAISQSYRIDERAIYEGIRDARWPARFEIAHMRPLVVIDGAHNPDGANMLARSLADLSSAIGHDSDARIAFVVGVLADKDYEQIIMPVADLASSFYTYTPPNPRALSASDLASCIRDILDRGKSFQAGHQCRCDEDSTKIVACDSAEQAMKTALKEEGPEGIIVAFGTLYSISEIRSAL